MRSGAGDAVAFASAIVFATGITLVALIYEDGANVHAGNLARWPMEQGIDSVSLNPDTVVETWLCHTSGRASTEPSRVLTSGGDESSWFVGGPLGERHHESGLSRVPDVAFVRGDEYLPPGRSHVRDRRHRRTSPRTVASSRTRIRAIGMIGGRSPDRTARARRASARRARVAVERGCCRLHGSRAMARRHARGRRRWNRATRALARDSARPRKAAPTSG